MSLWRNTTITNLANELLDEIGSHLSREDLIRFRAVGSHSIRNGTDYVFRQLHFRDRACRINDASIAHLYDVAASRFGRSIRYITIGVDLECQVIMEDSAIVGALGRGIDSRLTSSTQQPLTTTKVCLYGMSWRLKAIFKYTANLKGLKIYAPSSHHQLRDDDVSYIYDSWFQGPSSMVLRPTEWDDPFGVRYYLHVPSSRAVYSRILAAIVRSKIHLEEFRMLGFNESRWRARLGPVQPIFETFVEKPGIRKLTHLELEYEVFSDTNSTTIPCIVSLIAQNQNLWSLKLHTSGRIRDDNWCLLLDALAHQPPSKLRELCFTGAVANHTTTFDRVIHAHAKILRLVILDGITFDYPNSLRALLRALSDTKIEYFATRHFWRPHHRNFLTSRGLICHERDDEALEWHNADVDGLDTSYQGWVDVGWQTVPHTQWVTWYDGRENKGENRIGARMKMLLEALDASGIRD